MEQYFRWRYALEIGSIVFGLLVCFIAAIIILITNIKRK